MPLLRRRIYPAGLNEPLPATPLPRVRPVLRARVVWRFSDGKPGHDNQSRGLVEALQRLMPLEVHELRAPRCGAVVPDLLRRRFAVGARLPDPWLLVGAGRATQLALLAARRARRGRAVVLMTPQYPPSWFDLCIIPAHDRPAPAANVLVTRGSLNRMQRVARTGPGYGLLLIGGPSRHFRWDSGAVLQQLGHVIQAAPSRRWVLVTSRRTPAGFARRAERCLANSAPGLCIAGAQDSAPRGLGGGEFTGAGCAWVTEDSVSMVYEALTAGVATGLLRLESRGDNRIARGNRGLLASGALTGFEDWRNGTPLRAPAESLHEADRVASWIRERWG